MRTIITVLAAAVAIFMFGFSTASAHDWTGWQVAFTGGAGTVKDEGNIYNPYDLKPKGAVAGINFGYRFQAPMGMVLGVDAGAGLSDMKQSKSGPSCTIAVCGYDETYEENQKQRFQVSLGGSAGHTLGPVLVSAIAGFTAADTEHGFSYKSPTYPTVSYKQTSYRLGGYWGLRGEVPVGDRLTVGLEWKHSKLYDTNSSGSTGWTSKSGASGDAITARLGYTF